MKIACHPGRKSEPSDEGQGRHHEKVHVVPKETLIQPAPETRWFEIVGGNTSQPKDLVPNSEIRFAR
jgi:hypothetical protein